MKHIKEVQELCRDEIQENYSTEYEIEYEESGEENGERYEEYSVSFDHEKLNDISLRVSALGTSVCMGDDSWFEFEVFDSSVRYLWLALLG